MTGGAVAKGRVPGEIRMVNLNYSHLIYSADIRHPNNLNRPGHLILFL